MVTVDAVAITGPDVDPIRNCKIKVSDAGLGGYAGNVLTIYLVKLP